MSRGSEAPPSNIAVDSLVCRVAISRPVVTSGMVLTRIQSGSTARCRPGMLTQPRAQNMAVALLSRHLLEQANSIL